mmetsp:Transcript_81965/g.254435  ORF Transcript_81965/g.254435 Transcript_81965/m.254435 type:complete len:222 (-) Transcript_81965:232-897(-)
MLKWSFSTSCGIIDLVCARLEFGTTGKAPAIPRCRVHVWVEDQSRGEDAELAYCEGSVTLGNPVGHVRWLGRSRRREAHPAVRGRPCAAEVEAPTVAQSVLGLGAAVMRRFQCTGVDLLADDTGSGRLVQCYERLGMAGTQLLGPVARMNVPPPGSAGRTHARAHACAYACVMTARGEEGGGPATPPAPGRCVAGHHAWQVRGCLSHRCVRCQKDSKRDKA